MRIQLFWRNTSVTSNPFNKHHETQTVFMTKLQKIKNAILIFFQRRQQAYYLGPLYGRLTALFITTITIKLTLYHESILCKVSYGCIYQCLSGIYLNTTCKPIEALLRVKFSTSLTVQTYQTIQMYSQITDHNDSIHIYLDQILVKFL